MANTTNEVMEELRSAAKPGPKQKSDNTRDSGADRNAVEATDSAGRDTLNAALQGASTEALIAMIGSLVQRLDKLENAGAAKKVGLPEPQGPPPLPRRERPHIMAFIKPDSMVRIEVSEEYIESKQPGWDGTPVKAYANHENTVLMRNRY